MDDLLPRALTLTVSDLSEAIEFFTKRLEFRLEMIIPADAPHTAVISGSGVTLRLEAGQSTSPIQFAPHADPTFIISRLHSENVWKAGRAGMQYRDLIPGRLGGRVIASHISIPEGGDVPDYVHYHKVRFQMIFCKAGWARVVYEDQGPPFLMETGDCVLQPPGIRHRVLETSPGFEVIEVGSPAVHETLADHELQLPTRSANHQRLFGGQRFVRHRASETEWTHLLSGIEISDTGIAAATEGWAAVRVVRCNSEGTSHTNVHSGDFRFHFVLEGKLNVESSTHGGHQLSQGDSIAMSGAGHVTLRAEVGLEMLVVNIWGLEDTVRRESFSSS